MGILWTTVCLLLLWQSLTDSFDCRLPAVSLSGWERLAADFIERYIETIYDVQIMCENLTCTSDVFLKRIHVPILLSNLRHRENSYVFVIPQNLSFVASVLESAAKATLSKYVVFVECVECAPVEWVLEKYWQHKILDVVVILLDREDLPIYTYLPFRAGACFDRSPVLLGNYTASFVSETQLFPRRKVWNLHQCSLTVSSFTFPGIYFHGGKMKGSFSSVFNAVSESMNFSAEFIHTDGKGWFGSASDPVKTGIRGDVYTGMAQLGFGFIQAVDFQYLDFDGLALPGCTTWCVPGTYKTKALWWFVVGEFAYSVWMMLLVSGGVILAIDYLARKLASQHWLQGNIPMARMLLAAFLQVPQTIPQYSSMSFRLLWISCLLPSLVLSTVYLGTLKSLRTAPYKEYTVKNLEDLSETGLQAWYIKGQSTLVEDASKSNPVVAKLVSNSFAFAANITGTMFGVFGHRNITVLMLDKFCQLCRELYADKEDFIMYPLPKACMQVSAWHLFAMGKNSVFAEAITIRIARLTQAGLIQSIIKENSTLLRSADIKARQITVRNMLPALLLLSCGLGMSVVAFAFEMALSFLSQRKNASSDKQSRSGLILSLRLRSRWQGVQKPEKGSALVHTTTVLPSSRGWQDAITRKEEPPWSTQPLYC